MHWIFNRLALGDQDDGERARATDVSLCFHVGQHPYTPQSGVSLIHVPIPDEVVLPPATWAGLVFALGGFLRRGERVLVHCRLGKSRSPALVCAYLMQCGMAPEEALAYVQARRAAVAIHHETWRSVLTWHEGMRR